MDILILSGVLAIIVLLIDLFAIHSVWRTTKTSTIKLGWTALIFVFPVAGFAIWGIAGPRKGAQTRSAR